MTRTITNEVPVDFEFEWHGELYRAECVVEFCVDPYYGEDADGNRGETRKTVECVKILSVEDSGGGWIDGESLPYGEGMLQYIRDKAAERAEDMD